MWPERRKFLHRAGDTITIELATGSTVEIEAKRLHHNDLDWINHRRWREVQPDPVVKLPERD